MSDQPIIPRPDPERLQAERRAVDLGDEETDFAHVSDAGDAEAPPDEPTAGMLPPAR